MAAIPDLPEVLSPGGHGAGADEDDLLDSLLGSGTNLTAVGDTTFSSPPPTPAAGVIPPSEPFSVIEEKRISPPHSNTTGQQTHEVQPRTTPNKQHRMTTNKSRFRSPTYSTTVSQPKSISSRKRDTRLPSSSTSSVFDRLYKTGTAASKSYAPVRSQVRKGGMVGTKAASIDDCNQVFSRLHITGTAASKKRFGQKHPHTRGGGGATTPSKKGLGMTAKSPRSAAGGGSSPFSPRTPARTSGGNLVYSPRMKPKTKLLFSSKHHAGMGVQDVQPISLGYSFFQAFCAYEAGVSESKDIANEVVQAFFRQDFPQGRYVDRFDDL